MKQVIIENPIINSAFEEPLRHFRFDNEGITNDIIEERRKSHYFIPIAKPKKKSQQLELDLGYLTKDRIEENKFINDIRERVSMWRKGGYQGSGQITSITRRLLEHWKNTGRERRLFFCQLEALETVIYITEVAKKSGDSWIINRLNQFKDAANPLLLRMALKMATGTGKTVLMSMLIAYHSLNKIANSKKREFSDAFLIVAPGITIRDRLKVLLPNDPENYYKKFDLVPADLLPELEKAKIVITNYHAFQLKEHTSVSPLTKNLLNQNKDSSSFKETPEQMVRRVCRGLGNKKNIIVLNDEAHHCYRRKPDGDEETYTGDDRKEANKNKEEARIWISGLEAIKQKLGVKVVYDLSATPFYLKGSGYREGTLFPWVISDFSLIDAIESGIVKVPRVPVADDSMRGELPVYRNIWSLIRDGLPKKGRKSTSKDNVVTTPEPKLPKELEGALQSLYSNYEKAFKQWEDNIDAQAKGLTPPVFIVVCNNTSVSKLVYDYISGWSTEKTYPDGRPILVKGKLPLFSNVDENGNPMLRPNTILVDSEQLESGEAMTKEFKEIAKQEIEEFKAEYRRRFPGFDPNKLSDEDLLREVMNTVGKLGKLGEQVRCVVSVSMLTEGWDCGTVTHILGVRAFGTQLLCEQVVGRALRRVSYANSIKPLSYESKTVDIDSYDPEYAEVYGVPFAFIPCAGSTKQPKPGVLPTRVRAIPNRSHLEITFPRLLGYRFEITQSKLQADFSGIDCRYTLSTENLPTKTENAPIIGKSSIHSLDDLKLRREQEVAFLLAKLTLEKYFRSDGKNHKEELEQLQKINLDDSEIQAWLFPQVLQIAKDWLKSTKQGGAMTYKSNTYPQLLLLNEFAHDASDCIYRAITNGEPRKYLKSILRPYDTIGSTKYVDFDTSRPTYTTNKSPVNYVVADTNSWEQKMAQVLEDMDEVVCYVKNQGLGFFIPYTMQGKSKNYMPDFLTKIDDGRGENDLLNLIVEVSGEARTDKDIKVETARKQWIPAVNQHGGFGRWEFINITDPWDAENTIKAAIQTGNFNQL